jgi:hypothetical protein
MEHSLLAVQVFTLFQAVLGNVSLLNVFFCIVFGPPQMANSGTLIFATAGAKSSIEKIRPYIKGIMGRDEISFEDISSYINLIISRLLTQIIIIRVLTFSANRKQC